ncbi:predicted protein [Naegleria gruberi]|uniref:Predicted protein n=1 Tax=Naegleria gruberi TaxID=5762 RepID=D2V6E5_NAEGR|nr:uncharacterized protein NAEGRDRAFT_47045 [Naegleria gruberi]EFC47433.1 predicted protein [Naegleria gruberi]|eukprot:XP_002680177.1 predicted protein [Naegleria gruberi strain NEG-M]
MHNLFKPNEQFSEEEFKRKALSGQFKVLSDFNSATILKENQELGLLTTEQQAPPTIEFLKLEKSWLQAKELATKLLNENQDLKTFIETQENDFYEISEKRENEVEILQNKYSEACELNQKYQLTLEGIVKDVKAIQKESNELKIRITAVEKENQDFKKENQDLKTRITDVEKENEGFKIRITNVEQELQLMQILNAL